jgi:hypothetical protein
MLVCAVDGAVDATPLIVRVRPQRLEQPLPLAVLGPAVEAVEHGLPGAEDRGQITPRCARAPPPQNGLHEEAIILRRAAEALRREKRFDLRSLLIVQLQPNQLRELREYLVRHGATLLPFPV